MGDIRGDVAYLRSRFSPVSSRMLQTGRGYANSALGKKAAFRLAVCERRYLIALAIANSVQSDTTGFASLMKSETSFAKRAACSI